MHLLSSCKKLSLGVKEDIDVVRTQWVHADRSLFTLQVVGAHVSDNRNRIAVEERMSMDVSTTKDNGSRSR